MPRKVPHPGWGCCDLSQDLKGWLVLEYGRAAGLRALAREERQRGDAVDALWRQTSDWREMMPLDRQRLAHYGTANAYGQRAMMIQAHAERVEAAHQRRLA